MSVEKKSSLSILPNNAWLRVLSFLERKEFDSLSAVDKNLHSLASLKSRYAAKRLRYFLKQLLSDHQYFLKHSKIGYLSEGLMLSFFDMVEDFNDNNSPRTTSDSLAVMAYYLGRKNVLTTDYDMTLKAIIRLIIWGQHAEALALFKSNEATFQKGSACLLLFAAAFGATELVKVIIDANNEIKNRIIDVKEKVLVSAVFDKLAAEAMHWACYFGCAESFEILLKAEQFRQPSANEIDSHIPSLKRRQCLLFAMWSDSPQVIITLFNHDAKVPTFEQLLGLAIEEAGVKVIQMLFSENFRKIYYPAEKTSNDSLDKVIVKFAVDVAFTLSSAIRSNSARRDVQVYHCLTKHIRWLKPFVAIYMAFHENNEVLVRELLLENQKSLERELPPECINTLHTLALRHLNVDLIHFLMSPNHYDEYKGLNKQNDGFSWPDQCAFLLTPTRLIDSEKKQREPLEHCKCLLELADRKVFNLSDKVGHRDTTWSVEALSSCRNSLISDNEYPQIITFIMNETANKLRDLILRTISGYMDSLRYNKEKTPESFGTRSAIALKEKLLAAPDAAAVFHAVLEHLRRHEGRKGPGYTYASLDIKIINEISHCQDLNNLLGMLMPTDRVNKDGLLLQSYRNFALLCMNKISSRGVGQKLFASMDAKADNKIKHELLTSLIEKFYQYCSERLFFKVNDGQKNPQCDGPK